MYYADSSDPFSIISVQSASAININSDNTVFIPMKRLLFNPSYNYCQYVKSRGVEAYSEVKQFTTVNVIPEVYFLEQNICYIYVMS